ncbi:hypothetical protein [Los Azufres archaeal virus 1]|nr:hypothetical protein [Los Azufres archaeal virus 1]
MSEGKRIKVSDIASLPPFISEFHDQEILIEECTPTVTAKGRAIINCTGYIGFKIDNEGYVQELGQKIQFSIMSRTMMATFNKAIKPKLDAKEYVRVVPACVKSRNGRHYPNLLSPSDYNAKKATGVVTDWNECEKLFVKGEDDSENQVIELLREKGGEITYEEWHKVKNEELSQALQRLKEKGKVVVDSKAKKIILQEEEEL